MISNPPEKNLVDFKALAQRLGEAKLQQRLNLQVHHNEGFLGQCKGIWRLEDYIEINYWIELCFKISGLYARGRRNFLDIQVVENHVALANLPPAFEGFRILHITDLHTDLDPDLPDVVIQKIGEIDYDICVNTGDFRNKTRDCYQHSMQATKRVAEVINRPHYGVLGNHDYIEKISELEAMGITILLNESSPIEKEGQLLWLCGIDDPHFYKTHDLKQARHGIKHDETAILLSHSPEVYQEAAEYGYAFMLSGHTHGGQVCLPGNIPLVTHCDCPRKMVAGPWRYEALIGYTSRGTGAGTTAVRFNCPPEITVHTLTAKKDCV